MNIRENIKEKIIEHKKLIVAGTIITVSTVSLIGLNFNHGDKSGAESKPKPKIEEKIEEEEPEVEEVVEPENNTLVPKSDMSTPKVSTPRNISTPVDQPFVEPTPEPIVEETPVEEPNVPVTPSVPESTPTPPEVNKEGMEYNMETNEPTPQPVETPPVQDNGGNVGLPPTVEPPQMLPPEVTPPTLPEEVIEQPIMIVPIEGRNVDDLIQEIKEKEFNGREDIRVEIVDDMIYFYEII